MCFFLAFHPFPVPNHIFGTGGMSIAEDVRMTANEFVCEIPEDVGQFEPGLVACDLGIKNDLKQQIPQFFLQHHIVISVDGFEEFVGLLEGVGTDRFEVLHAVPGTAVRGAQPGDDFDEPPEFAVYFIAFRGSSLRWGQRVSSHVFSLSGERFGSPCRQEIIILWGEQVNRERPLCSESPGRVH